MKTLKIPQNVHQELKMFVAANPGDKITDVAGYAIMAYLKTKGHKFQKPTKVKKP
jgi:hypothetical protein